MVLFLFGIYGGGLKTELALTKIYFLVYFYFHYKSHIGGRTEEAGKRATALHTTLTKIKAG